MYFRNANNPRSWGVYVNNKNNIKWVNTYDFDKYSLLDFDHRQHYKLIYLLSKVGKQGSVDVNNIFKL